MCVFSTERPGITDPVGQAKYDAWLKKKGRPIRSLQLSSSITYNAALTLIK